MPSGVERPGSSLLRVRAAVLDQLCRASPGTRAGTVDAASARASSTRRRSRPWPLCSSTVTSAPQRRASASDSLASSGLAKRALSTATDTPSVGQLRPAASSAGWTRVPKAMIADVVAVAQQLGLAERQRLDLRVERHALSRCRRGKRTAAGPGCSMAVLQHVRSSFSSLGAITTMLGRCAGTRHVVEALVGGAVGPDEAGAIEREASRRVLQAHVVHHLVVGALQEGRVDRRHRLHPLGREAPRRRSRRAARRCRRRRSAPGTPSGTASSPVPVGHGRRDADDAIVVLRQLDQRVGEHVLCTWADPGLLGREVARHQDLEGARRRGTSADPARRGRSRSPSP